MTRSGAPERIDLAFLQGGGEMGRRLRELDWAATPVGSPASWPQSLRSTVSMMLPSKAQIILFWGPEFTVFYNDAYRPVFGAKHPWALGRPGREAWSEIWEPVLHELLAGVVRTGEAFWAKDLLFEIERHGFPEETYFDVSYDPVRVESGEVGGVYCIVTETTERVVGGRRMTLLKNLAERNVAARTTHDACVIAMETLGVKVPDVRFALVYLDDKLECCTTGAERDLEQSPPELVQSLTITSSIAGAPEARLVLGLNPQRPYDAAYRGFVELVAGQLGAALTNARAYEIERERAEELANAQRQADSANRAKDEFIAMLSHELRNPLSPILTALQLMRIRGIDEALRERAIIERQVGHLVGLVDDLLDVSRITKGKIELKRAQVELAEVVVTAVETASPLLEARHHHLGIDVPRRGLSIDADRGRIAQVVANLLTNAAKYTEPSGSIEIVGSREGDTVVLEVRDNGSGIDPELQPAVFDLFTQARQTLDRSKGGLGLGLAIVRSLVTLHGGTVGVISEGRGKGSTFTVRLPWVPMTHVEARSPERLLQVPSRASGAQRILIVDDNNDSAEMLAAALATVGYSTRVANDAVAALRSVGEGVPDIALLDIGLPVMNGYELARRLKSTPGCENISLVAVTGYGQTSDRMLSADAGFDAHLVKPIDLEHLAHVVAGLRRAGEEPSAP